MNPILHVVIMNFGISFFDWKFQMLQTSASQPPGRGPVSGPGIDYTGPRGVCLEIVILVF
jgi:hypothetical protein